MSLVDRGWNVEPGVAVEEADRLEHEADLLHRHHRPVLWAGDVQHPEHVPEDDVIVDDSAVGRLVLDKAATPTVLVGVVTGGETLAPAVVGHPQVVAQESGPTGQV